MALQAVRRDAINRVTVVGMPLYAAHPDPQFAEAFEALGIRTNDALVLRYIAANPGQTHRTIAAALGVTHATVHRICGQYAASGIIVNTEGRHVRRYSLSVPGLLAAAERYLDTIINPTTDTGDAAPDREEP